MQDILAYKGWIVAAAFLLLFGLERMRPVVTAGPDGLGRLIKNLSFWPLNIGLSLAVILPISYLSAQHTLWQRPDWLLGPLADVILLDLFMFWWHRALHETPFLWRFHEVHHLDETLDTTSAIRFHFGEIFLGGSVRVLAIVLLAIPFSSIVFFETLVLVFTLFHHSNMALPPRLENILSRIFVTPSIHWVHHHALRKDTDSNYGTIFSFWDRIFRTRSRTRRFRTMPIGVEGKKDMPFLRLMAQPFAKRKPATK